MSLRKVPGSRNYHAESDGFKELGRSAWMSGEVLAVASKVAGNANAVGEATYSASGTTVHAGWSNEARAGAKVSVTSPHWRDSRDSVLLRVVASMTIGSTPSNLVVYTRKDGSTRMATQAQANNWSRGR